MGFHRNEIDFQDWNPSLRLSTKIPRSVKHVDGSNALGNDQKKTMGQKRSRPHIKQSLTKGVDRGPKVPNTKNNAQQRKPIEMAFSGRGDAEKESEGKKTKYPAKLNSVPKARQYRQPIGRNKD